MEVTFKTLATMVKTDTYYFKPRQAGGHGPLLTGQGFAPCISTRETIEKCASYTTLRLPIPPPVIM